MFSNDKMKAHTESPSSVQYSRCLDLFIFSQHRPVHGEELGKTGGEPEKETNEVLDSPSTVLQSKNSSDQHSGSINDGTCVVLNRPDNGSKRLYGTVVEVTP